MKGLIITTLFLCSTLLLSAQFRLPTEKEARAFVEAEVLLVTIVDKDAEEDLKELLKTDYEIKHKIEFVSWDEANEKASNDPKKYAMLLCTTYTKWTGITGSFEGPIFAMSTFVYQGKKRQDVLTCLSFSGNTRFHIAHALRLYSTYVPAIAKGFEPYNTDRDVERLSEKTLLIAEGMEGYEFDVEDVSKAYGGKIKIVSPEFIAEAAEKKDPRYAVFFPVLSANYGVPMPTAIDLETKDMLAATSGLITDLTLGLDPLNMKSEYREEDMWKVVKNCAYKLQLRYFLKKKGQSMARRKVYKG